METVFRAMDTEWALLSDRPDLHAEAERRVRAIEEVASRFLPGSALSTLNRDRRLRSPLLAELVGLALEWRGRSGGLFDPTKGAHLRAAGYKSTFASLPDEVVLEPIPEGRLEVSVREGTIELEGEGELDLGGIAKGWAVDRVHDWLRAAGATRALVDGGGDTRFSGQAWCIGVGDDDSIELFDGAVATSSTERRQWRSTVTGRAHHILDPRSGRPSRSPLCTVTIRAQDAVTAEVLAKAVLIDPDLGLPLLLSFHAAATVCDTAGRWWSTPDWSEPS